MAQPQDHVRALDQLRNRLSQLSLSISSLKAELEHGEPLPSWPALQSTAQILGYNLQQVAETMSSHRQLLSTAHAYPLPNFPGHTHEGLAQQLLRKKLDPRAENWIDGNLHPEKHETADTSKSTGDVVLLKSEEMRELWDWAGPTSNSMLREFVEEEVFEDEYTIAEREYGIEKVVTGLKRKLGGYEKDDEEEDDEGEAEDGDKMEEDVGPDASAKAIVDGVDTTKPAVPLETLLKFMSTGDFTSSSR